TEGKLVAQIVLNGETRLLRVAILEVLPGGKTEWLRNQRHARRQVSLVGEDRRRVGCWIEALLRVNEIRRRCQPRRQTVADAQKPVECVGRIQVERGRR